MITLNEYGRIVESEFGYLTSEFELNHPEVRQILFHFDVFYKKRDLIVGVEYSFRNEYIEVAIYKNVPSDRSGLHSARNTVLLEHILDKYKKDFDPKTDYHPIMPKALGMNDSVKQIAVLFKQYASDFLTGQKWESWGDITGYRK